MDLFLDDLEGQLDTTRSFKTQHGMETLNNTAWDVLIAGTGLQQSLLAL